MTMLDAEIVRLARRQHQCFSRSQAGSLGFSAKQMRQRVRTGLWLNPHRDVFVLAGAPSALSTRSMAATLALPGSAVSHATAASLRGDADLAVSLVHLSRLHGNRHRLDGVRLHQSRCLPDHHITTIDGIPATTRSRTAFDLAVRLDDRALGRHIDELVRRKKASIDEIGLVFSELARPGRPGSVRMARVLDRRTGVPVDMSELERRFAALCRRARIPSGVPEFAAPWRALWPSHQERVDFAYERERVIVELDGRAYHTLLDDFENDRRRDQLAIATGWRPLRFTWAQVTHDRTHVEQVLRATLALECQGAL